MSSIVIGEHRKININSKPTPKQPLPHITYNTSKQANNVGHPPPRIFTSTSSSVKKSASATEVKDQKRPAKTEDYKLKMPQFIVPEPVKFNQEELVSFVSYGEFSRQDFNLSHSTKWFDINRSLKLSSLFWLDVTWRMLEVNGFGPFFPTIKSSTSNILYAKSIQYQIKFKNFEGEKFKNFTNENDFFRMDQSATPRRFFHLLEAS